MAETAEIMAEDMKPEKKVAFAQRKYTNEEKRKMEEEELEQMLKEQKGEAVEITEPEEEPTGAEEKTFYGLAGIGDIIATCSSTKQL